MVFIVCAKWWRSWQDYTQLHPNEPTVSKKGSKAQLDPVIKALQLSKLGSDVNPMHQSSNNSFSQYKRPGPISLKSLLHPKSTNLLRNDLMEHFDYELVLPEVWRYFTAWYGCVADMVPILRPMGFDKRSNKFFVDLYLDSNIGGEEDVPFSDRSLLESKSLTN